MSDGATVAAPSRALPPATAARAWPWARRNAAPIAVVTLAAALRLAALARTAVDPFYAAAVRSMGTSWHAFLVGAFDPSARVAVDKPPVDLWLQVASTKLLGFGPFALLLPAALGGTLAVVALYDLLRTLAGRRAALAGALALAVLPVAVMTSRSDTMDSLMAALVVAALAVAARGLRRGSVWHMVAAGGLVGLAFEVKLFEALVVALPLGILAAASRRWSAVAGAAGACVGVGLAWLVVVTLAVPAAARPWAFGSSDGSPWNSAFVYDGWHRLAAAGPSQRASLPAAPGPLRLLSAQDHLAVRLGVELAAAWAAVALVVLMRAWRPLDRTGRAGLAALAVWLALGTMLFSLQGDLRPRYLEAFDPAVAACLGAGVVLVGSRRAAAAAMAAALVVPLVASIGIVAGHVQDSGTLGAVRPARLARLSAYVRARDDGARYELASAAASPAAPLIARDGRPVLVLSALGHPLVSVGQLRGFVARDEVRFALVGRGGGRAATWIRRHGVDVSRAAGQRAGRLYALSPPTGTR